MPPIFNPVQSGSSGGDEWTQETRYGKSIGDYMDMSLYASQYKITILKDLKIVVNYRSSGTSSTVSRSVLYIQKGTYDFGSNRAFGFGNKTTASILEGGSMGVLYLKFTTITSYSWTMSADGVVGNNYILTNPNDSTRWDNEEMYELYYR